MCLPFGEMTALGFVGPVCEKPGKLKENFRNGASVSGSPTTHRAARVQTAPVTATPAMTQERRKSATASDEPLPPGKSAEDAADHRRIQQGDPGDARYDADRIDAVIGPAPGDLRYANREQVLDIGRLSGRRIGLNVIDGADIELDRRQG